MDKYQKIIREIEANEEADKILDNIKQTVDRWHIVSISAVLFMIIILFLGINIFLTMCGLLKFMTRNIFACCMFSIFPCILMYITLADKCSELKEKRDLMWVEYEQFKKDNNLN